MKILTFLLLTFSAVSSTVFAESLKIGYINIERVISSSPQFIEANQSALAEFKPQEEKLLILKEEIKARIEKFGKNKDNLSKEELQSEFEKISALEDNLKQKVIKLQQALKLKSETELRKIENLIKQIVRDVAKEKNYDLILYQVAYANDKINITSLISEKLRASFK